MPFPNEPDFADFPRNLTLPCPVTVWILKFRTTDPPPLRYSSFGTLSRFAIRHSSLEVHGHGAPRPRCISVPQIKRYPPGPSHPLPSLRSVRHTRARMSNRFYLTTAIAYVNGQPHLGHAYEKVITDVIARARRSLGEEVFFLTGLESV